MQILEGDLLRKMNSSRTKREIKGRKKEREQKKKNASRTKHEIKEQEERKNASRKKHAPRCLPYASIQSHLRA